jgi:hypothetical protein
MFTIYNKVINKVEQVGHQNYQCNQNRESNEKSEKKKFNNFFKKNTHLNGVWLSSFTNHEVTHPWSGEES